MQTDAQPSHPTTVVMLLPTMWPSLMSKQNLIQGTPMTERKLFVNALDGCISESTIKLKITDKKNLQYLNDSTTKLARIGSGWRSESGVLNR